MGKIFRQEFESKRNVESGVFGFVDDPHPASAEFFDDPVMRDGLADERVGIRHGAVILVCGQEASQRT